MHDDSTAPNDARRTDRRVIAYIDGLNLYYGLRGAYGRKYMWLDIPGIITSVLDDSDNLAGVRYFAGSMSSDEHDPGRAARQQTYLEALESCLGVSVTMGSHSRWAETCPACGHTVHRSTEKKTDVNIAIAMVEDAYEDRFDMAVLVSRDADLIGAVTTVQRRFPEKMVALAPPPGHRSTELLEAAARVIRIKERRYRRNQMPDEMIKPDGYVLRRPDTWR